MIFLSLQQGRPAEPDDPKRKGIRFRDPGFAIQSEPHLMRLLRCQPMKTEGRKQANGSPWNSLPDFGKGMILPSLSTRPRIEPPGDTLEDSLPHKISKLCPPNSVRFKIARPENARGLESGYDRRWTFLSHFNMATYIHNVRRYAIKSSRRFLSSLRGRELVAGILQLSIAEAIGRGRGLGSVKPPYPPRAFRLPL